MYDAPAPDAWPPRPYLGLDFYHETDAILFHERGDEIHECAELLLGFDLKLLLLHGSSGSGKSSFLRAGLIPYLKHASGQKPATSRRNIRPSFFLNTSEHVIRCTANPLFEITRAILTVLDGTEVFARTAWSNDPAEYEDLLQPDAKAEIKTLLQSSYGQNPYDLETSLRKALNVLCRYLPGSLVLFLDQAEEVLTRDIDTNIPDGGGTSAAFFRFLEEIYIQNFDVRLIVTLRSEYYGPFRDALGISDDRLAQRPASGGLQPYMLKLLRDRNALVRIIEGPTGAKTASGASVYDFQFATKGIDGWVVDRIVDDLLGQLPGSVLPGLQVVCDSLYSKLTNKNREITLAEYETSGGVLGIIQSYVEQGIRQIGVKNRSEIEGWILLLVTLVSRQGGGTVVSLSEPGSVLCERAQNLGLKGDIEERLAALTRNRNTLLRGEPRSYSLKHDVLAVYLSRWDYERGGAVRARREERRRARWIVAGVAAVMVILGAAASLIITDRWRTITEGRLRSIYSKNEVALHPHSVTYPLNLLLLLHNLAQSEKPINIYDKWFAASEKAHADTEQKLRQELFRTPWAGGSYGAAGFTPDGGVAVLRAGALSVLELPQGEEIKPTPVFSPPFTVPEQIQSWPMPVVGFIKGLGQAVFIEGKLYYWVGEKRQVRDVFARLKQWSPNFTDGWPSAEFVGGGLLISKFSPGAKNRISLLWLDGKALQEDPPRLPEAGSGVAQLVREFGAPQPVYSGGSPDFPPRYAALDQVKSLPRPAKKSLSWSANSPDASSETELEVSVGSVQEPATSAPLKAKIGRVPRTRGVLDRQNATLAFFSNREKIVFKPDGNEYYLIDLPREAKPNSEGYADLSVTRVAITGLQTEEGNLGQSSFGWLAPPLAAVQIGNHTRVAWLNRGRVVMVETSDADPTTASPVVSGPLLGESFRALKLEVSNDGNFLFMSHRQQPSGATLRVWDLRPAWQRWLAQEAELATLRKATCRIISEGRVPPHFEEVERYAFQIDAKDGQQCFQETVP